MKPVQYFNDEYLERCKALTATEKMRFLDNYRKLHAPRSASSSTTTIKSKLISLKVPEDLLANFRQHCDMHGIKYQTQIKQLMRKYLELTDGCP